MSKKSFIKGLILKQDATEQPNPQVGSQPSSGKVSIGSPIISSTTSIQGVPDQKFIDTLEGVIEQNNQPGQDYFEFKQALENMKSMVMDEKTKFQTVFTVLSLQQCTKAVLLSSLDKYIQLIQNEKSGFDTEMQSEYSTRVQAKINEVEAAKKELEEITKKMTVLNNKILTLSQEAQAEEMKIKAIESNFKASADVIISEMVSDKEKINTYIA